MLAAHSRTQVARWFFSASIATLIIVLGAAAASATSIVVDGNITDMILAANEQAGAGEPCPFNEGDPPSDIVASAGTLACVPLVNNYFANGFDQTRDVLVYDRATRTLYLGLRVAGVIGDTDGNGNANTKCLQSNINDAIGIGPADSYRWDFNLDCAGAPEMSVEVKNNAVTVTGAIFGTKTFAFSGSDLEIGITNIDLVPAYDVQVRVDSEEDRLSTDFHAMHCSPPAPEIFVDVTANPSQLCFVDTTTIVITVKNGGAVPLLPVNVVDNLPPGLSALPGSFASTCGLGLPVIQGTVLTWPSFTLAPGATCVISFQAVSDAQCLGSQTNTASVMGSFSTPCFQGGTPQSVTDVASAALSCLAPACVKFISLSAPASACPNQPLQFLGAVQNCGLTPAMLSVSLTGGETQELGLRNPGETVNFSFLTGMPPCTVGAGVGFEFTARASNSCSEKLAIEQRLVTCGATPCVDVHVTSGLTAACPGEHFSISGVTQNCGKSPEDLVVRLGSQSQTFTNVPPGESRSFSFPVVMDACVSDSTRFVVTAFASTACGSDTDVDSWVMTCVPPPCMQLTVSAPPAACEGAVLDLVATVINCSNDLETMTVSFNGLVKDLGQVQPGASAQVVFQSTMTCGPGQSVPFTFVATARNKCTTIASTRTVSVACDTAPCVDVAILSAPTSACPNAPIQIQGVVKNCGLGSTTIQVTLNGGQVQNLGVVGAGFTIPFTFALGMPPCTPGQSTTFTVVASAANGCNSANDQAVVGVLCGGTPCVNISSLTIPTTSCSNAPITIQGTVQNCGDAPATIQVSADAQPPINLGSIPAGGSVPFAFTGFVLNCNSSGVDPITVVATATNSCGNDVDSETRSVICESPPCVQLTAAGPSSACPGAPVAITGTARNCSLEAEGIRVSVNGTAVNLGRMAPGQVKLFSLSTPMPACSGGQSVAFNVIGTGTSSCGSGTTTQTISVACGAPCVRITSFNAPASACISSTVTLSGTALNCSGAAETITIRLDNGSPQTFTNVPPGASRSFSFTIPMISCIGNPNIDHTATAIATDACGTNVASSTRRIRCVFCREGEIPSGVGMDDGTPTPNGGASALYRPIPNPFSTSMSYGFRISGSSAANVEIGVYDLAGRRVRRLAGGLWAPGEHAVKWDGTSDQGARATPGIYFLRARVGAEIRVNRVTILRP